MRVNTWGIGQRAELAREFEPEKYPFIERVREHLGLSIIEIKGQGEPAQIALGSPLDGLDSDAAQSRVSPFFSSFDSLDFFCRLNLQHYLAYDPAHGLPRRWFWEDRGSVTLPMPGAAMRTVRVRVAGSAN
ncbi:MAG: hypothetical protein R3E83_20610 [Burkholderiaceae bacterium]